MIIKDNDPYSQPSFTFSNRVRRFVWGIVYTLFFRTSPRPFHWWRSMLLKAFGATLGKDCHVYPGAKIWAPWNLVLGDFVGVADGVDLYAMDVISIGSFSVISQGAYLCCGSHDYNSGNFQLFAKPITIGTRVWICADVFIHPGVNVPDGCVIGARSVVTKSIDTEWFVYAGNPCTKLSARTH